MKGPARVTMTVLTLQGERLAGAPLERKFLGGVVILANAEPKSTPELVFFHLEFDI
jgi:hypothetical protein